MKKPNQTSAFTGSELLNIYYQRRVSIFIASISSLVFFPLAIKNLMINQIVLGGLIIVFQCTLLFEISAIYHQTKTPWGFRLPLSLVVIIVVMAIHLFGTLASYWLFPVIISIAFLLPPKDNLLTIFIIIPSSIWVLIPHQTTEVTLRFSLAISACAAIMYVVVDAIRKLHTELFYLSTRDALTGSLNRHQLESFLRKNIQLCQMGNQYSVIAVIDIDHFKTINDLYGHDTGDKVITQLVEMINTHSRELDLLFRLGGDEFLLLFENTRLNEAMMVVSHIGCRIQQAHYPKHAEVTISAGLAEVLRTDTPEQWFKRADLSLYHSKKMGKNRVCSEENQVIELNSILCDSLLNSTHGHR
ncbi:GGDEF domain-containing protein [Vibrio metoecus]|uniref:GGDEF domain-containing protein n=1 Tax=Vibrio metoecus TaxID=1481663 RepID=UPI0006D82C8E|nr:GGDEF domain-containing protein [Vibrio metoecus]KQB06269.1 diguanylate cyclase [Vibrio metoecus]PAR51694.1 GGDEF domain-containing protein [Vibrio metoecus]